MVTRLDALTRYAYLHGVLDSSPLSRLTEEVVKGCFQDQGSLCLPLNSRLNRKRTAGRSGADAVMTHGSLTTGLRAPGAPSKIHGGDAPRRGGHGEIYAALGRVVIARRLAGRLPEPGYIVDRRWQNKAENFACALRWRVRT